MSANRVNGIISYYALFDEGTRDELSRNRTGWNEASRDKAARVEILVATTEIEPQCFKDPNDRKMDFHWMTGKDSGYMNVCGKECYGTS